MADCVNDAHRSSLALDAIYLLGGGIRTPEIVETAGRMMWSLALTAEQTVLDLWLHRLYDLVSKGSPEIKLLLSTMPNARELTVIRCRGIDPILDAEPYRGPAGALRDATTELSPEQTILVADLSRCVTCDLSGLLDAHHASENEVTVAANADGSPAGLYIVSAECLATIPSRGYVDLKEQWLADLRSQGRSIGVHTLPGDGALPLRTSREFIDATRKITPASVVVVSEDASHHDRGPLPQTKPIVVRSSIFPDGSIKTASNVVDGSSTGSPPLDRKSVV